MAAKKEIKVKVTFTEGYQRRFTEACLEQLQKREQAKNRELDAGSRSATA